MDKREKTAGCTERDEVASQKSRFISGVELFAILPKKMLICLITVYQKAVSPWLPPSCRFVPTCSQYAVEALQRHGLLTGSALALWRILRCQPFCKGGYDPVPEKKEK